MSNKEKLAHVHLLTFEPCGNESDTAYDSFISGYEAAEQEMIKFAEWCAGKYEYYFSGWSPTSKHEGGYFTTEQLLDRFRTSQ